MIEQHTDLYTCIQEKPDNTCMWVGCTKPAAIRGSIEGETVTRYRLCFVHHIQVCNAVLEQCRKEFIRMENRVWQ